MLLQLKEITLASCMLKCLRLRSTTMTDIQIHFVETSVVNQKHCCTSVSTACFMLCIVDDSELFEEPIGVYGIVCV